MILEIIVGTKLLIHASSDQKMQILLDNAADVIDRKILCVLRSLLGYDKFVSLECFISSDATEMQQVFRRAIRSVPVLNKYQTILGDMAKAAEESWVKNKARFRKTYGIKTE